MGVLGKVSFGLFDYNVKKLDDHTVDVSDRAISLEAKLVRGNGNLDGIIYDSKNRIALVSFGNIYSLENRNLSKAYLQNWIISQYLNGITNFYAMLNGQFCFILVDFDKGSVYLSVDKIGIESIFYLCTGDAIYFSDDIKLLLAESNSKGNLDYTALLQMFFFSSIIRPRTIVEQVKSVEPGTYIEFTKEKREQIHIGILNLIEIKNSRTRMSG